MANEQHLAIIKRGAEAVKEARARDPNLKIDLSQANLDAIDLSNLDLSGADFSNTTLIQAKFRNAKLTGANLSGARLDRADLTGVDLSGANVGGANLLMADLTGILVTAETKLGCNLQGAKFSKEILHRANIAGASLYGQDLCGIDLSGRDLRGTNFSFTKLSEAKFSGSNLTEAHFPSAELSKASLRGANLTRATLHDANLSQADLVGVNCSGANLRSTNFHASNIANANFHEAYLDGARFDAVEGAYRAKNLRTSRIDEINDVRYFDQVVRKWPERVDWELIRIAGRLPLFGASYGVLILIPTYMYALEIYNKWVKVAGAWADQSGLSAHAPLVILRYLHEEPIPSRWGLLLTSTVLLAAASTIYAFYCPSRVKSFSRDQWCDEHRHSLVHYWSDAWKWRTLRLFCAAMYFLGGLGALFVLITKLWGVGVTLIGAPSAWF